jgi:DNA-binding beta-propeller fold protein YncE
VRLRSLLPLAAALLLAAPAVPADARRVAYVVNQGSATVSAFALAPDGSPSALGAPVPTGGAAPVFIALTPDGRRAYVTNSGPDTVSAFAVAPDGTLAPIGAPVASGGADPNGIAVSPDGTRVYVANLSANTVSAFAVAAGGSLSPVGAPVPSGGISTRQVAVTPDGRFVWVVASSTSTVRPFAVQPDGSLVAAGPALDPAGADLFDVAFAPDGTRAYGVDFGSNDIVPFTVAGDGQPVQSGPPVPHGGDMARVLALAPDGRRMLAPGTASATVSLLTVADGGGLALAGPPAPAGGQPYAVAVAPSGRAAYASDDGGSLLTFSLAGGVAAAGAPLPTGGVTPRGIAITPNQGPVAAFAAAVAPAGQPSRFDAAPSADADGLVAAHAWDFGDGTTGTGPRPEHVYARPGTYTVRLTVADDEGCSTARVFTGKTAHCTGGPAATTTQAVTVPAPPPAPGGADRTRPVVSAFSVRPRRFRVGARPRRGTRLQFRLSETTSVRIRLQRLVRRRGSRRSRPIAAGVVTRARVVRGRRSLAFTGRVRGRALRSGRYRATLTARDAAGNVSRARRASFVVLRARRR